MQCSGRSLACASSVQPGHLIAGESNAYDRTWTHIATPTYVTALCVSCENITDDRKQKGHAHPLDSNSCAAWPCDVNDDVGHFVGLYLKMLQTADRTSFREAWPSLSSSSISKASAACLAFRKCSRSSGRMWFLHCQS